MLEILYTNVHKCALYRIHSYDLKVIDTCPCCEGSIVSSVSSTESSVSMKSKQIGTYNVLAINTGNTHKIKMYGFRCT